MQFQQINVSHKEIMNLSKLHKESITELLKMRENFWIKTLSVRKDLIMNRIDKQYFFPLILSSLQNAYRYQESAKQYIPRGASRTSTASEMKFFVTIDYSFKLLTIFIKKSVLDVLGVLNRSMITSGLLMTSKKLIFCRLLKYKTISLENDRKVETSPENLSLYQRSSCI